MLPRIWFPLEKKDRNEKLFSRINASLNDDIVIANNFNDSLTGNETSKPQTGSLSVVFRDQWLMKRVEVSSKQSEKVIPTELGEDDSVVMAVKTEFMTLF